ncbi:MAG: AMP-binding protein, partial [bacterium]|nr:AMP-binding protein [bacterium]
IGVPGECCVGGDGVARGYLNRPDLTAEKFIENTYKPQERLYRSGDLVKVSILGEMEYLGRIDHQVKVRGYRIELGEIENQLRNHPQIKEAVVLAHPDKHGSNQLCAYVVPYSEDVDITELKQYLSRSLPDYMIPAYFMPLEELPLNANGKTDRQSLPEPVPDSTEGYIAPRDAIETQLVEMWMETLGVKSPGTIGIDDDFFQLGGQSLTVIFLAAKIHKTFNAELTPNDIFQAPRIRELARKIKNKSQPRARYVSLESVEE